VPAPAFLPPPARGLGRPTGPRLARPGRLWSLASTLARQCSRISPRQLRVRGGDAGTRLACSSPAISLGARPALGSPRAAPPRACEQGMPTRLPASQPEGKHGWVGCSPSLPHSPPYLSPPKEHSVFVCAPVTFPSRGPVFTKPPRQIPRHASVTRLPSPPPSTSSFLPRSPHMTLHTPLAYPSAARESIASSASDDGAAFASPRRAPVPPPGVAPFSAAFRHAASLLRLRRRRPRKSIGGSGACREVTYKPSRLYQLRKCRLRENATRHRPRSASARRRLSRLPAHPRTARTLTQRAHPRFPRSPALPHPICLPPHRRSHPPHHRPSQPCPPPRAPAPRPRPASTSARPASSTARSTSARPRTTISCSASQLKSVLMSGWHGDQG